MYLLLLLVLAIRDNVCDSYTSLATSRMCLGRNLNLSKYRGVFVTPTTVLQTRACVCDFS